MKKILVIDDEQDFGLLMKNFFTAKNYQVFTAYTIEEGMKLLEKERPDYIFLDNDMPDGAGWTKTEYILMKYPNAKLNLISALGIPKRNTNSFRILEKPLALEELTELFH